MPRPGRISRLTPRQREAFDLAVLGLSARQIGLRLFRSDQTIERHWDEAAEILGTRNKVLWLWIAIEEGYVTIADELALMAADCSTQLASASVTFRRRTGRSVSVANAVAWGATVDTTITVIRGQARQSFEGDARAGEEEVMYSVLASQLSNRPTREDLILDGTKTCTIIHVAVSLDERFYEITTRRGM